MRSRGRATCARATVLDDLNVRLMCCLPLKPEHASLSSLHSTFAYLGLRVVMSRVNVTFWWLYFVSSEWDSVHFDPFMNASLPLAESVVSKLPKM